MRIAVLTQPLQKNYGGLLQAFALQTILVGMGHDVYTVDIPFRTTTYWNTRRAAGRALRKYLFRRKEIADVFDRPSVAEEAIIQKNTRNFIRQNIRLTEHIPFVENIDLLRKYRFDSFIVGSDQVWRPKYSPGIATFFLDFLENEQNITKIAYAASFGTDSWEFSLRQTKACARLARLFNGISVREASGVELCRMHLGVHAHHLIDPTLLLEQSDYLGLIDEEDGSSTEKPVVSYILDPSEDKSKIVKSVSDDLRRSVRSLMPRTVFSRSRRREINECIYPPVGQWLKGFRDAEFVITDSFHGLIFSLIFEKPFIVIANEKRGGSRFASLLELVRLRHRLVWTSAQLSLHDHSTSIEFADAREILAHEKRKAMLFLKKHLSF